MRIEKLPVTVETLKACAKMINEYKMPELITLYFNIAKKLGYKTIGEIYESKTDKRFSIRNDRIRKRESQLA